MLNGHCVVSNAGQVQATTVAPNQQPSISLVNPALLTEMRWSVKLDSSNAPFILNSAVSH